MLSKSTVKVRPFPQARVFNYTKRLGLSMFYLAVWRTTRFYRLTNRRNIAIYQRCVDKFLLPPAADRVLNDLRRDGVAYGAAEEFIGTRSLTKLYTYCDALARNYLTTHSDEESNGETNGKYTIHYKRLEERTCLSAAHAPTQIITSPIFSQIAANHLQLTPRLRGAGLLFTNPFQSERAGPQLWHRDARDHKFFKLAILLDNYGKENGAMEYICGTHAGGAFGQVLNLRANRPRGYFKSFSDAEVASAFPSGPDIRVFTGGRGTLIFYDTSGIHRSGYDPYGGRKELSIYWNTSAYTSDVEFTIGNTFEIPDDPFMRCVLGVD